MYEQLSDEDLAQRLAAELGVSIDDARTALDSETLGRRWAISILESRARHEARQERITRHRENLRRAAAS